MKTSYSRRRALLVGIDSYPHLGPLEQLRGGRRDAEETADLLERRFGFAEANLRLLLDGDATRETVLRGLDELVEDAGTGDFVVFGWSGHGSQLLELRTGDHGMEPDGLNETLVPTDAHRHSDEEPHDILDHEIRRRIHRLDASRAFATLIFDSCHSGHVHRDAGPRARSAPLLETRHAPELPPHGPRRQWRADAGARQVILAACRDHEKAWERCCDETGVEGIYHGHFTYALLHELRAPDAPSHAVDVLRRVRARVLAESPRQTPQIAGAEERLLFGVEARPFRPYVRVVRSEADGHLELDAGRVQNLHAGSVWSIYPPETLDPFSSAPLGHATVERVGSVRSRARLEVDARAVPDDAHAYLVRPAPDDPQLAVNPTMDEGPLGDLICSSPLLRIGEEDADVRVRRLPAEETAEGPLAELGAPREPVHVVTDARDHPLAVLPAAAPPTALLERLERRARYLHGLTVENQDPATAVDGLELRLLRRAGGSWVPTPVAELPTYRDGERIAFQIVHHHAEPLHVYVVDFGLTDRVSQVHPFRGEEELLDPGRRLCFGVVEDDPVTLRLPDDFDAAVAPEWRRTAGIEIFVLFASREPADLRPLLTPEAGALRSVGDGAWGTTRAALELRR